MSGLCVNFVVEFFLYILIEFTRNGWLYVVPFNFVVGKVTRV